MSGEPIKKLRLITGFERVEEAVPRHLRSLQSQSSDLRYKMTNFLSILMGRLSFSMVERTFEATGRGAEGPSGHEL